MLIMRHNKPYSQTCYYVGEISRASKLIAAIMMCDDHREQEFCVAVLVTPMVASARSTRATKAREFQISITQKIVGSR